MCEKNYQIFPDSLLKSQRGYAEDMMSAVLGYISEESKTNGNFYKSEGLQ